MPQPRGLYLRVGAMVVAGLVLAVGFVLFLTASRFGNTNVLYETYVRESVQGLEVGAPVRYRGVAIGRVAEIGLVAAEYPKPNTEDLEAAFQLVFVRFAVDTVKIGEAPPVAEAVKLGLRVRIAAQGITGVNYLEVDFVDPDRFPPREVPWEPRSAYIPAVPSTVQQVQNAAEVLLQRLQDVDLQGLIGNVVRLMADLRGQVHDGDVAVALREAVALLRSLREAAASADLPGAMIEARGALAEVRGVATEARGVVAEARGLLESRDLRQALADAAAAAASLRTAAARLPATLGAVQSGVRAARGTTTDLQADLAPLLRDMLAAVANLRDTTEALRRSPAQAIFGAPPPQEPRR